MFLLVSVWDYVCAALCIIDPQDKPFGADLPIEVQNRILWMAWHADHQDRLTMVHQELEALPACSLTDWLRVPKPTARFHSPWNMHCNCDQCGADPSCHWCLLYGNKHSSIEFTVLETKLQRIRDTFDCYEEDRYEEFVHTNLPIFRDVLQYTLAHIIVPMLVWLLASRYHCNCKRSLSGYASFASVRMAHVRFIEACIETGRVSRFRNPRAIREEHDAIERYQARKKAEKQEEH